MAWILSDAPEGPNHPHHDQGSQTHWPANEAGRKSDPQMKGPCRSADPKLHLAEGQCCLWDTPPQAEHEQQPPLQEQPI